MSEDKEFSELLSQLVNHPHYRKELDAIFLENYNKITAIQGRVPYTLEDLDPKYEDDTEWLGWEDYEEQEDLPKPSKVLVQNLTFHSDYGYNYIVLESSEKWLDVVVTKKEPFKEDYAHYQPYWNYNISDDKDVRVLSLEEGLKVELIEKYISLADTEALLIQDILDSY